MFFFECKWIEFFLWCIMTMVFQGRFYNSEGGTWYFLLQINMKNNVNLILLWNRLGAISFHFSRPSFHLPFWMLCVCFWTFHRMSMTPPCLPSFSSMLPSPECPLESYSLHRSKDLQISIVPPSVHRLIVLIACLLLHSLTASSIKRSFWSMEVTSFSWRLH